MIYSAMTFVNIFSVLFVSLVISMTSKNICIYTDALAFIDSVRKIPHLPDSLFVQTVFCCLLYFAGFLLRSSALGSKKHVIVLSLFSDIIVSVVLLFIMNCNYNGFVLWVLASVICYVEGKVRISALVLGIVIYIISSFDLINLYYPLFSIKDYILYYPHSMKNFLLFIHYGLSTVNLLCFILFCVNVIQFQRGEIDEIHRLNEELKKLADIKEKMGRAKERNRLAAEIHDTVGHSLTGISVGVDACIEVMDKNPELAKKQLMIISSVAKDGMNDIRRSVHMMKNEEENDSSLSEMIADMLEKTRKATGVNIEYNCNAVLDFDEDENHAIFRVVQESVTNSIRHGKARNIVIDIAQDDELLKMNISDDGCGCKKIEKGFGLFHMKERIEMLKGEVKFESDRGFRVWAVIPLRKSGE